MKTRRILGFLVVVTVLILGSMTVFAKGKAKAAPLKLLEAGWIKESFSDNETTWITFCGKVQNPNAQLIAEFPKLTLTVKAPDGTIASADEYTGSIIMGGDAVWLIGQAMVPTADITPQTQFLFDVGCSEFAKNETFYQTYRTTDFVVSNVSEKKDELGYTNITGEITNMYPEQADTVHLTIVMKNGGNVVYADSVFIDDIPSGGTKAFLSPGHFDLPAHDSIEFTAMSW